MLIKIKNDLFNINKRIKKIDNGYYVCFNTKNNKYEVHNKLQLINSYCCTLPYEKLDERTINYLLKTQSKNAKSIFEEIERNNEELKNKNKKNIEEINSYKLREIYNYSNKYSKTLKIDFNNLWF